MKRKVDLDILEKIMYYFTCLTTLGGAWIVKIIIKKAIIEANEQE